MKLSDIEKVLLEQQDELDALKGEVLIHRPEEDLINLNSKLAQVVIGVRRSGKSTLCFNALRKSGVHYAYANFDDERLEELETKDLDNVLQTLYKIYGKFDYLFLDEIQNIDGWPLFVNRLLRQKIHIIITGSNAKLLSAELATHLTGRHHKIELFPFSFKDWCSIKEVDYTRLTTKNKGLLSKAYEEYFHQGGFPELISSEENPKEYMRLHCQERIQKVIDSDYAAITEFDFLSIMRAALIVGDEDMLMELLSFVQRNTKANGEVFDLYTTSVISTFLIDFYNKVENQQRKNRIRRLLFEQIMYMQSADHSHMSIEEEVQYVCALYEFESEVSFPVSDITELILSAGRLPREFHNLDKQIRFYEKSRESIDALLMENDNVNKENMTLKKYKISFYACLTIAFVLLYVAIYLLIIISDEGMPLITTLFGKIKETWVSLFTLIIVPVASYIYNKFLKK